MCDNEDKNEVICYCDIIVLCLDACRKMHIHCKSVSYLLYLIIII